MPYKQCKCMGKWLRLSGYVRPLFVLQKSESAVMFSLAYMTIFLKHISNVALMREFLCYLMQGRYDGRPVLNTLVQNISSTNHLVRPHTPCLA